MLNPLRTAHALLDPGEEVPATDLELIQQRQDLQVVPLKRNDRRLLAAVPGLGRVASTTANSCVTCTLWGQAASVLAMEGEDVVFDQDRGLRWIGETWRHSVAAVRRGEQGRAPCLLLFGEHGELIHRIALEGMAGWDAFASLVKRHQGCMNCLKHSTAPDRPEDPFSGSGPLIREAWRDSRSYLDFDTRIEKLGLDRLQVVQALDGLYASPMDFEAFGALLDRICTLGLPVDLQVGNLSCTQFLECTLDRIERSGEFWKLIAPDLVIRIEPSQVESVWSVVQSGDADRRCIECYDTQGLRVFSLACPQGACPAMKAGWSRLCSGALGA